MHKIMERHLDNKGPSLVDVLIMLAVMVIGTALYAIFHEEEPTETPVVEQAK